MLCQLSSVTDVVRGGLSLPHLDGYLPGSPTPDLADRPIVMALSALPACELRVPGPG